MSIQKIQSAKLGKTDVGHHFSKILMPRFSSGDYYTDDSRSPPMHSPIMMAGGPFSPVPCFGFYPDRSRPKPPRSFDPDHFGPARDFRPAPSDPSAKDPKATEKAPEPSAKPESESEAQKEPAKLKMIGLLLVIGGVAYIAATLLEDVLTAGAGIANDVITIPQGVAMIAAGI